MVKKIISVVTSAVILCATMFSFNVSASDTLTANVDIVPFETLTKEQRDERIESLISTLYSGDMNTIRTISTQFNSNTYETLSRYIANGSLGTGVITTMVTDYIEVENSNDGDFVAMINLKITRGASDYLYLLEFHYNYSGVIYGYNIWEY